MQLKGLFDPFESNEEKKQAGGEMKKTSLNVFSQTVMNVIQMRTCKLYYE